MGLNKCDNNTLILFMKFSVVIRYTHINTKILYVQDNGKDKTKCKMKKKKNDFFN